MAKAEQLKALIQSHAAGDDTRFYAVAMQVAAQAARTGRTKFAKEVRDLVDSVREEAANHEIRTPKPIPLVQPRGELAGLLIVGYPKARLSEMALSADVRCRLQRVLDEQAGRHRIREFGLRPRGKLLLVGPPGTGKTMTASVLACELGLPLFTIQLHGLITKYMGETAAKLRLVFDAIAETRAVYLFDEFDAFASERSNPNEVGEIRRVLNSFLQFLEQDQSDSLIVAATNHRSLLDRALFRRFDSVIEYTLPDPVVATQIMKNRLTVLDSSGIDWTVTSAACDTLSQAEISRACDDAAKQTILTGSTAVGTDTLLSALAERRQAASA